MGHQNAKYGIKQSHLEFYRRKAPLTEQQSAGNAHILSFFFKPNLKKFQSVLLYVTERKCRLIYAITNGRL